MAAGYVERQRVRLSQIHVDRVELDRAGVRGESLGRRLRHDDVPHDGGGRGDRSGAFGRQAGGLGPLCLKRASLPVGVRASGRSALLFGRPAFLDDSQNPGSS